MNITLHKSVHFIGICGVAMAPIAKMFQDIGWKVTGSDKGFFPPVSDYLRENNIHFWAGWHPERLDDRFQVSDSRKNMRPDLVVVGNFIGQSNPEFEYVREQGIPYKSYPEIVAEYIVKKNSIVVAGTFGKTTITALLAWILELVGKNPSYMAGGLLKNFPDGVRSTESEWSVVEGDEYSTSRWDARAKFFHYRPRYLVITSTQWDHTDLYQSHEEYISAFCELARLVPEDGCIVYDAHAVDPRVVAGAKCPTFGYSYEIREASLDGIRSFTVGGNEMVFSASLIGAHNAANCAAAATLARIIGISDSVISEAIKNFKGVRRRLEVRADARGIKIIDDLAHSPAKARASIEAVRATFPRARIRAVFEPNIGSRTREALPLFAGAFDQADEVYIPRLSGAKKNAGAPEWVEGGELMAKIKDLRLKIKNDVWYIPDDEELVRTLVDNKQKGDIILFMGSHGFRGMIGETVQKILEPMR